jgi:hypothetical protein
MRIEMSQPAWQSIVEAHETWLPMHDQRSACLQLLQDVLFINNSFILYGVDDKAQFSSLINNQVEVLQ